MGETPNVRNIRDEEDGEGPTIEEELLDMLDSQVADAGFYEVGPVDGSIPAIPMKWKWTPGMKMSISVTFSYEAAGPLDRRGSSA